MSCAGPAGFCMVSLSERVRLNTSAAGCVMIRRVCAVGLVTAALSAEAGARVVAAPAAPCPVLCTSRPAAGCFCAAGTRVVARVVPDAVTADPAGGRGKTVLCV